MSNDFVRSIYKIVNNDVNNAVIEQAAAAKVYSNWTPSYYEIYDAGGSYGIFSGFMIGESFIYAIHIEFAYNGMPLNSTCLEKIFDTSYATDPITLEIENDHFKLTIPMRYRRITFFGCGLKTMDIHRYDIPEE